MCICIYTWHFTFYFIMNLIRSNIKLCYLNTNMIYLSHAFLWNEVISFVLLFVLLFALLLYIYIYMNAHSIIFATVFEATVNLYESRWRWDSFGDLCTGIKYALLFEQSSVSFQEALRSQHVRFIDALPRRRYAYSKKNRLFWHAMMHTMRILLILSRGFFKYKNVVKVLSIILYIW